MRVTVLLAVLSFSLSAAAQSTTVSPKDAVGAGANSRGVSGLGYGFNISAHHLQQLHDFDSFSHGQAPFPMSSIGFRMPSGRNVGNQGGARVEIAVQLSLAPALVNANAHTTSFAKNRDESTARLVFRKKTVLLPTLGSATNPSLGFDFRLKFDGAPFVYVPSNKRTLVLDLFNYTIVSGSNNYFVDGWTRARSGVTGPAQCALMSKTLGAATDLGQSSRNGSYLGCTSSANQVVTHTSDPGSLVVGYEHVFEASSGVNSAAGVMSLGAQALNVSIPGTSCTLVNDLILLVPFAANAAGEAAVPLRMPPGSTFVGARFYTQFIFVDPRANTLGLVTSNGMINRLGLGFGDIATTNTIGRSLIVEFR